MKLNSKAFNLPSTDKYSGELIFTYGEQLIRPLQEMTQDTNAVCDYCVFRVSKQGN